MRAAAVTLFALLIVTVGFIVLNLQPATISLFGFARITQPVGVVVSLAFLGGALIVYLLMEGAGLRRSWQERHKRKVSRHSGDATGEYLVGLEALVRGDAGEAREALNRALAHDPDHVGALLVLGNLEREAGDVEGAIRRHITANARKPGTPAILWALAEDYAQAGRIDESIRALDDLSVLAPNEQDALKMKRDVYEAAGRLEEALKAGEELLRAGGPDDGSLTRLRLKAAQGASEPREAQAHLEAALKHEKGCAAAYTLLGEILFEEGNSKEAVKTWERGWKATGDLTLAHRLAESYVASGQGKKALKLLGQARGVRPDDPLPALLYAQTAIRLEASDEAEMVLASELLADHPASSLLRLELAQRSGREESISDLSIEAASALSTLQWLYECGSCEKDLEKWTAQCPACQKWDTVQIAWIGKVPLQEPEPDSAEEAESDESE